MTRAVLALLGDLEDTPANRSVRELLRWSTSPTGTAGPSFAVVASEGGVLQASFAALVDTFVVNDDAQRTSSHLQGRGLHRVAEVVRSRELRRRVGGHQDIVWVADVRAARLLHWVGPAQRVVAHLHASDPTPAIAPDDLAALRRRVSASVAGSPEAAVVLHALLGVAGSVHRDLEALDRQWAAPSPDRRGARRAATRAALRDRLDIPVEAPLVVAGGTVDFWHASNTFAQACWDIRMADPALDHRFVWLAEGSNERMLWPLRHDLAHAGLSHVVRVVGDEVPSVEALVAADVHLRTGRDPLDPFEVSELANAGPPIVAYESPTFPDRLRPRARTMGWLDVHGARDAVLALATDPAARRALGEPPPTDLCDWDPRIGGPRLAAALVGGPT